MPDEEAIVIEDTGSYIPTTTLWDITSIYDQDVNSQQFKELIVRLYQTVNNISNNVNLKETGYYPEKPFLCGKLFFPNPSNTELTGTAEPQYRPAYRIAINFGALPNSTTKSVAHNLTLGSQASFIHIYGTAKNPGGNSIPLPYPSASPVELYADSTKVYIKTTSDYSAYTTTYVVLEYIQS